MSKPTEDNMKYCKYCKKSYVKSKDNFHMKKGKLKLYKCKYCLNEQNKKYKRKKYCELTDEQKKKRSEASLRYHYKKLHKSSKVSTP